MHAHEFLTRKEAALYLGVSCPSLARWACNGVGPTFYRLGRDARYDRADLDAFLIKQRREPARPSHQTR